jgi:DNA-binding response OmpR family regulator
LDLGHHVDLAWDFESAVEYAASKLYDLILIDLNIDQRSSLVHQIQNDWRISKETPIISLSSYEDNASTKMEKEHVFHKHFKKKDVEKIIKFFNILIMDN